MNTWFQRLSIQAKLFSLFGFIALIGAVTVGLNFFTIFILNSSSNVLYAISERQLTLYQGISYLQNIELAQESFALSASIPFLDDYANYHTRLETFVQRRQLETTVMAETAAFYTLERALDEHQTLFLDIVRATFPSPDLDEIARLRRESRLAWDTMHAQFDALQRANRAQLDHTVNRITLLQTLTSGLTALSLLLFAALTLVVAVVIRRQMQRPIYQLTAAARALARQQQTTAQPTQDAALAQHIAQQLSPGQLHALCHALAVAYTGLAGQARVEKVNALLAQMRQPADRVRLFDELRRQQPETTWEALADTPPPFDATAHLHTLLDRADEIGQLAQTFVRMAQEIQAQEYALDTQAADLRAQIALRQ